MTTFNKNDIKTPEEAKEYLNYRGGQLTPQEKAIFDDARLTPNGVLNLDLLQGAAQLLNDCKTAETNLKIEKASETGLSTNGNALLIALMVERRNNSIAYQLVNEKDVNEEGRVDKVFHAYQAVLFRPEIRNLKIKKRLEMICLESIEKEEIETEKKIKKAKEEVDKWSVKMAENYRNRVQAIVNALKADLAPSQPGYNFHREMVENSEKTVNIIYRTNASYPNTLGSIIKTGIKDPYSSNPWTHPIYLSGALPFQMKEFFHEFDKNKLFALVEKKFSSDSTKITKFKESFERVINSQTIPLNNKKPRKEWNCWAITNIGYDWRGGVRMDTEDIEELKLRGLYPSDIFRVMHTLFPQDTPGLDFSNSEFLKMGGADALPFKNVGDSVDKELMLVWRGRENSFSVDGNYKDVTGEIERSRAFPCKEIKLKWNGEKDKDSLPQFFWQVYNSSEAVQFGVYRDYLSKDGTSRENFSGIEFSVYDSKLVTRYSTGGQAVSLNALLTSSYKERIKGIITGEIEVSGHKLTDPFTDEELEVNWPEFKRVYQKLVTMVRADCWNSFTQQVQGVDYAYRKQHNLPITWVRENPKNKTNVFIDSPKKWEDVFEVCEAKIAYANQLNSLWGTELAKRDKIVVKKRETKKKLKQIEDQIKALETGRIDHLRTQFKYLGDKLINPSDANVITYQETIAIRTLHDLLTELDSQGKLETPLTDTEKGYLTKLEQLEAARNARLPTYHTWTKLGSDFGERLKAWKNGEGLNLGEKGVRTYFGLLKNELNSTRQTDGINFEEESELVAINNYLNKVSELWISDLILAFCLGIRPSDSLLEKWKNYGNQGFFKTDREKLEAIGKVVNYLDDLQIFFDKLKVYLKDEKGIPAFPEDSASEQDKINWFFLLDPEHVIKAVASFQIESNSTLKINTETAMKNLKNPQDNTKGLDLTVYGDGANFTEAGIIKYYAEELGGINHSYAKQKATDSKPTPKEDFLRINNPAAWLSGIGLLLLLGGTIWAWRKRKTLAQWWNAPSELEDELDEDEEED